MKIEICLTPRQTNILQAVMKLTGLSDWQVIGAATFALLSMQWDNPRELKATLLDERKCGYEGSVDDDGRLPCGLKVESPRPVVDREILLQRAIEAECRRLARCFRKDPRAAGIQVDERRGTVNIARGGSYRWTGHRIRAVA